MINNIIIAQNTQCLNEKTNAIYGYSDTISYL